MIVTFTNLLKAYSGKCDGLVYMYNRRLNKLIARRLPVFVPHEGTKRLGQIARNLKSLQLSEGYRSDLRLYPELSRFAYQDDNCYNWMNAFSKLMWGLNRVTGADLATISRLEIETLDLPCRTVKRAIEAGLLPPVEAYQKFDSEM
ncbi:MAG: hypothetical protein U1C33_06635 [Candidatus Cloacimonadaceae bacterium]|nr:hypothetical protein [Candidatus Cloacimonadaceae bacterium]